MPPSSLLIICLTGALISVQIALNTRLSQHLGFSFFTVIFTAIQLLAALLVWGSEIFLSKLGLFESFSPTRLSEIPFTQYCGGIFGVFILIGIAYGSTRLGVVSSLIGLLAGQLLCGLLMDQFGLFGIPQKEATISRWIGIGLVFIGLVLSKA